MGVGVTGGCGADAGIDAYEDADEVGGEGVGEEVCEVGVFGWRCVRGGWAFFLGWEGRGGRIGGFSLGWGCW